MRSEYSDVMPGAMKAMAALVREVRHSSLEPALVELVKVRASQINGCAFCVDTHVRAARFRGESDIRLHLLSVWRDAPCYSESERAALRWCEEVTLVAEMHASDAAYAAVARVFSEDEIVALTYAIISINGFNRLSVAFRQPVDEDRSPLAAGPEVPRRQPSNLTAVGGGKRAGRAARDPKTHAGAGRASES
jgi:AhpD family alkylhydroperoxidase